VIRKSADLRNAYSEISDFCHKYRETVFITKNGAGDLAVMSIETYEEITGERKLKNLLMEGLNDIKNGNITSEEEMDKLLEEADNDIENGNFLTEEEMNKKLDLL
jgi:PHD/YefM family antitoxin component YafN of YafNO toxin-antitoxin module